VTTNKRKGGGQGSSPGIVARLQALIGSDVLLLHWSLGSKGEKKRWGHLTIDAMKDPTYLARLGTGNIGVAQGKVSNGLCSIDSDIDSEIDGFLDLNPRLATSLRTKGQRGCNIWFRMDGESCPTTKIKMKDGRNWGELRANGSQTIIHGKHPKGCDYSFVVEAAPVKIDLSEIVWPEDVIHPFSKKDTTQLYNPSSVFCDSVSCVSVPLCDTAKGKQILVNIEAANERREALKRRFPELAEVYEKFIEPKFKAAAGHRNGFIVEAAPFVYRVVCGSLALQFLQFFYETHRDLFKDTPEEHYYEAQKMLEYVVETYRASLSEIEQNIYDALPDVEKDVFRILRDLALRREQKCGLFEVFMSCKELGDRLQCDRKIAWRILRRFEDDYKLIKPIIKGKLWHPGEEPQAPVYRWLLNP
jgi:hypothetical protein